MDSSFVSAWNDYEITDAGDGEKLERWGAVTVIRPDPQIIWHPNKNKSLWRADMRYIRSKSGGGHWETLSKTPDKWHISYNSIKFIIKPTDFKHMGLFPEQAANWEWAERLIKNSGRPIRVLNLFGYTGGATVSCIKAGATVTHVDAAKGMNVWAKDNMSLNALKPCRIITDDVYKFVVREKRRGNFYDAIIMDPPSYGRGPSGEVWKLENRLYDLVAACIKILSTKPLFFLLNTYTTGFTAIAAENVLRLALEDKGIKGEVKSGSLALFIKESRLILPCGITARCEF